MGRNASDREDDQFPTVGNPAVARERYVREKIAAWSPLALEAWSGDLDGLVGGNRRDLGIWNMPASSRGSLPAAQGRVDDRPRPPIVPPMRANSNENLAGTVRPLFGRMERLSRRILQDDGLADDAVQEALLTYWAQGEPPENPQAWLLHAVTLRSLHLARTNRRRRKHEKQACLGRPERTLRDDPSQSLDHQDLLHALDRAMGRLTDEYRSVFILWAVEEMDYAGIASTLQIPIGTVRSRLNRSRRVIRQTLSGLLDDHRPFPDRDFAGVPTSSQVDGL